MPRWRPDKTELLGARCPGRPVGTSRVAGEPGARAWLSPRAGHGHGGSRIPAAVFLVGGGLGNGRPRARISGRRSKTPPPGRRYSALLSRARGELGAERLSRGVFTSPESHPAAGTGRACLPRFLLRLLPRSRRSNRAASCACAREQARTATYGMGGGGRSASTVLASLASPDSQAGAQVAFGAVSRTGRACRGPGRARPSPARSRARSLLPFCGRASSRRGASWPSASCTGATDTRVRSNALFVGRDVEARACSWRLMMASERPRAAFSCVATLTVA
jgi:hypothetical protein